MDSLTFDAFAKSILDRFWKALPQPWTLPNGYRVGRLLTRNEYADFQRWTADTISNPFQPAGWVTHVTSRTLSASEIHAVSEQVFNLAINELVLHPLTVPSQAALLQLVQLRTAFVSPIVYLTFPQIGRLAQLVVETNPQIRNAILATYSHVFLDEFQDTTGVQYGLFKAIFGSSNAVITAVGDDKQRIMGWAGAQQNGFDLFVSDFLSQGTVANQGQIALSVNYRSNARIVEILNKLKANLAPGEPDFRAVRQAPSLPIEKICSIVLSSDEHEEGNALGSFLAAAMKSGLSPREVGLLVRQKAAEWETTLVPILSTHGVALRNEDKNVGGASIQDLMTEPYAQTIIEGVELLLRARGGAAWGRVLDTLIELEGLSADEEPERVQELSTKLYDFHESKRDLASVPPSTAAAIHLVDEVEAFFGLPALKGSAPQYQQQDFFEAIRHATRTFFAECADREATWDGALARYRGENQVPLLTITKSKGLEYSIVILLGLDDTQWWSFRINPTEGHSTFFVAASRARERLYLTIRRGQQVSKISEIYKLLRAAGVGVIDAKDWTFS
ncbi:superfamily I DNA/RNA helicase [Bradyrhizobium japonicum]|nr:superfamily I DNA/RNA helicase [Bradyrhizobium japonicum]